MKSNNITLFSPGPDRPWLATSLKSNLVAASGGVGANRLPVESSLPKANSWHTNRLLTFGFSDVPLFVSTHLTPTIFDPGLMEDLETT